MSDNIGYSWSLDISTTNVGAALWNENGELLELKHLKLNIDREVPEEDRYIYKANVFKKFVEEYNYYVNNNENYNYDIVNVFVEKPLPNTKININTTAKLLSFNGIACYILFETLNIIPTIISVHDSRKIFCPELIKKQKRKGEIVEVLSFPENVDKKDYIWKKVAAMEPQIEWFYTRNDTLNPISYDMSDAYVVGYSGLRVLEII
jgi:hypothetical protein